MSAAAYCLNNASSAALLSAGTSGVATRVGAPDYDRNSVQRSTGAKVLSDFILLSCWV